MTSPESPICALGRALARGVLFLALSGALSGCASLHDWNCKWNTQCEGWTSSEQSPSPAYVPNIPQTDYVGAFNQNRYRAPVSQQQNCHVQSLGYGNYSTVCQ